jgi:hypothetical protein
MEEPPDIYLTGKLTSAQMTEALSALPRFFRNQFGDCLVNAVYGWGCNLHPSLCYRHMEVGTSWLERFIADSLSQRIVEPGDSDFIFEVREKAFGIKFCHEGDIHTFGANLEAQKALWGSLPFSNFPLCRAPDIPEMQPPKKPWF